MKIFDFLFSWCKHDKREIISKCNALPELQQQFSELGGAIKKLARSQMRAATVAESERAEIQLLLKQSLAVLNEPQKQTLLEILLVVDGLEEGIRALQVGNADQAWADGFHIVHERLLNILQNWHVKPMTSIGQPFTPHLHCAVDSVQNNEVDENTIVEEQKRGYLWGEQVLRYAQVIVARKEKICEDDYRN